MIKLGNIVPFIHGLVPKTVLILTDGHAGAPIVGCKTNQINLYYCNECNPHLAATTFALCWTGLKFKKYL